MAVRGTGNCDSGDGASNSSIRRKCKRGGGGGTAAAAVGAAAVENAVVTPPCGPAPCPPPPPLPPTTKEDPQHRQRRRRQRPASVRPSTPSDACHSRTHNMRRAPFTGGEAVGARQRIGSDRGNANSGVGHRGHACRLGSGDSDGGRSGNEYSRQQLRSGRYALPRRPLRPTCGLCQQQEGPTTLRRGGGGGSNVNGQPR